MSDTYRRDTQKRAFKHLRDSSSSLIDFRSKLIFVNTAREHPNWNPAFIKAWADTKALFVTLFQDPLTWVRERRMMRKMRRAKQTLKRDGQ